MGTMIKTTPDERDTPPISARYFARHGVSCAELLGMVEEAVREAFNPGLSDQEFRDLARHRAFHWNPQDGSLKENFVRIFQYDAQEAFAKKPTETLRARHSEMSRQTSRRVSETLISMAECEPAERPVQSEQYRPTEWKA